MRKHTAEFAGMSLMFHGALITGQYENKLHYCYWEGYVVAMIGNSSNILFWPQRLNGALLTTGQNQKRMVEANQKKKAVLHSPHSAEESCTN